jgi:DNA polymerase-3 subunit delta
MEYQDIIKDWKQKKFKPLYWLEGEEDFFIDQVSNYAEHKLLDEAEKGFNLTILYGKDTD